jgi:hypothetical protein
VAHLEGQFHVADSESTWVLTADCFGATLHRTTVSWTKDKDRFGTAFQMDRKKGTVTKDKLSATVPQLANWTSAASDATTLAVTVPFSHRIYLIAARTS